MNEYKPQRVALYFGIVIGIIVAGLMLAAFANGAEIGWTGYKLVAIELGLFSVGLLMLIFIRFFEAILLKIASLKAMRWIAFYDKSKGATGDHESTDESHYQARHQGRALRDALRLLHGWRWRYRQPWLLLTGNEKLIGQLVPELVEAGWRITPDAVLLWCKASSDGQLDTAVLEQIYQLRRRRPVDAVLLVTDGVEATTTDRQRSHEGVQLLRITEALRYSAPIYALEVMQSNVDAPSDVPLIACELPGQADAAAIQSQLLTLRGQLGEHSLARLPQQARERDLGYLSQQLDTRAESLASWLAKLMRSYSRHSTIRGILFAPVGGEAQTAPPSDLPLWHYVAESVRNLPGRRTAWHPITLVGVLFLTGTALWIIGMLLSGLRNTQDVQAAKESANDIRTAPNAIARLQALDTLQQQIQCYEYRIHHHAPLSTRFGLNRDDEILAALWKPYAKSSRDLLIAPVTQDLEATLTDLSQLQTNGLNAEASKWALAGRDTLKTYLMLAKPERADAAFLSQQLAQHWTTDARITPGQKQDLAERFARFYAEHLKSNPEWRITPRAELVAGTRQTLLAVIGERNAQDTIYQGILDGVGHKYPDLTLASLTAGTDARGLLRTTAVVPGAFTRQAYEEHVAPAIEQAAKRRDVVNDWVLTDGRPSARSDTDTSSGLGLQTALTDQYFADYAEHWQQFMNTLQWEPAPTLPGVIDQLKLMADVRLSPVIALMKSLEYQASAGIRKESLPDALVNKAKDLLGKKREGAEASPSEPAGPLTAGFGPVLRLISQSGQGNAGELSLQRFLDRATALRLRLQQVSDSPDADAQARQLAMALFKGKGSELADTQAYAQLIAASLGSQWAGMGDALFVRPIAQATQTVLQPAQASLNDDWRQSIALPWKTAFAGRYPFTNSANDASFAELARYLRPQSGLIHTFLVAQLGGVLEQHGDQWLPATNAQGLAFDPAFLKTIATLQRIGAHMLTQGDARYRFELKPIPTPGLTDTLLTIDNQKLHYFNQRETWQTMTWPVDNLQTPRTILQWQTETAGTSANYEFGGRWGLVRMLERARIVPLDSATFQLTWQAVPDADAARAGLNDSEPEAREPSRPDNAASLIARDAKVPAPSGMVYPIRYQMRADVGTGPLEMLELRDLQMPERIFMVGKQGGAITSQTR
ncbi:ImcF-related family protein [Cupriavidus pinatubonensis]|uniref:Type VI secretion protein VasK n=1 Tax=Cupriavidus pinatubonensis TaxID=248026 RepID=A0ABN7Y4F0_9BURK|nr:ImcF-related family protein [Cupriavidus pinatubonensis]CAG9168038.1 hypothetical protein LMG23994_01285 [Cupriavidus pinatubonensis]